MRIHGFDAIQVVPIPGSDDLLVVVEYHDFRGTWPNLFRVSASGEERWAAAPGGADAFTSITLDDARVVAKSHHDTTRIVDLESGDILDGWPNR